MWPYGNPGFVVKKKKKRKEGGREEKKRNKNLETGQHEKYTLKK